MEIKIAANFPNPPYFYTIQKNNSLVVVNGIDFHLIRTLMKCLNRSYQMIHSDWEWGQQIDGQWTGMVGKITDKSADMAVGALSADPERLRAVDFTIPYYYSDITFFTQKAKLDSIISSSLLLKPFAIEVWICLILSFPFSLLLMKMFGQKSVKILKIMIRALLQQNIQPIPSSLRIFSISWIIYSMILFHEYMAFLVIYMSELMPTSELANIEELALAVENGEYIPATSAEGSLHKFIKEMSGQSLKSIGKSLIGINQINKAMKLMLTSIPKLVYISPRLLFNARSGKIGSDLFYLPPKNDETTFTIEQLSIALPKNYSLKQQINKIIRRMESSAHLQHWERISMSDNSLLRDKYIDSKIFKISDGITIDTIYYIFFIWFICLCLALIIYFCEYLMNYLKRNPFSNWQLPCSI